MEEVVAFSPSHITGFFQICDKPADPLLKGSRGAGVSITDGVKTKVTIRKAPEKSLEIRINSRKTGSAQVSEWVAKTMLSRIEENYEVVIDHLAATPIGFGFGSSGAGALSLALALNEGFSLGFSPLEAAQVAHSAEVQCKTGLGTVIAETYGGVEIRVKPGAPGIGEVRQIPVDEDYVVTCLAFSPIKTEEALTDNRLRRRINGFGGKLVDELIGRPQPSNFMRFSRSFAEQIGLISPRMKEVLRETDDAGLDCSMMMFGESIFSLVESDAAGKLTRIFHKYAPHRKSVMTSKIDFRGARLLW